MCSAQEEGIRSPAAEVSGGCQTCVSRTEFILPPRAARAPNHWAISTAPIDLSSRFIFMYPCASIPAYDSVFEYPRRQEEAVRCLGTGSTGIYKLPVGTGNWTTVLSKRDKLFSRVGISPDPKTGCFWERGSHNTTHTTLELTRYSKLTLNSWSLRLIRGHYA